MVNKNINRKLIKNMSKIKNKILRYIIMSIFLIILSSCSSNIIKGNNYQNPYYMAYQKISNQLDTNSLMVLIFSDNEILNVKKFDTLSLNTDTLKIVYKTMYSDLKKDNPNIKPKSEYIDPDSRQFKIYVKNPMIENDSIIKIPKKNIHKVTSRDEIKNFSIFKTAILTILIVFVLIFSGIIKFLSQL